MDVVKMVRWVNPFAATVVDLESQVWGRVGVLDWRQVGS